MSVNSVVIGWLLLPAIAAFVAALSPRLGRPLLWAVPLLSLFMALSCLGPYGSLLPLNISTSPAITLQLDAQQLPFVLLNALVLLAIALQRARQQSDHLQPVLLLVLHGALNSIYLAADLVSIYVAIELISIVSFLLMVDLKRRATLWVAFRYLMLGDLAMLLFLLGVLVVYAKTGSFAIDAAASAPAVAILLILVGLLIKSEAFLPGFWLPKTHAAISAEVSALLSGSVVTAGIAPLSRLGLINAQAAQLMLVLGLLSVVIGGVAALVQNDIKRLLAWSTVSQMGFALLLPPIAGLYALAHGLGKAALFLAVDGLPDRSIHTLQQTRINGRLGWPMLLASLSLIGLPLSLGYGAKTALVQLLPMPLATVVGWLGVITALVLVKLLPDRWSHPSPQGSINGQTSTDPSNPDLPYRDLPNRDRAIKVRGIWLLCIALFVLPVVLQQPLGLSAASLLKLALVLGVGVVGERLIRPALRTWTPPDLENFKSIVLAIGITLLVGTAINSTIFAGASLP